MKTLLANKKALAGVSTILVGLTILLAGLSLAWFTSSGSSPGSTITMGKLDVVAALEGTAIDLAYPGGSYRDLIGTVQNKEGSIPALVKLTFSTEVTIKSDANGNLLPEDQWQTVVDPTGVSFRLQEDGALDNYGDILAHPLGAWLNLSNPDPMKWASYYWQIGKDGSTYVWLNGYDVLHFAYTIDTDGASMGNEYMNAVITVSIDWEAAQAIPDSAIADIFGITDDPLFDFFTDYSGLVIYNFGDPETVFLTPFSVGPQLSNADKVGAMAERFPEGAFRSMLEKIQKNVAGL